MNRVPSFAMAAAAAFLFGACEQHPASELEGEGLSFEQHRGETKPGEVTRPEAPKAPTTEATNPAGAAPVQPANDKGAPPASPKQESSPTLFPPK